jgi:hypothetical protein
MKDQTIYFLLYISDHSDDLSEKDQSNPIK